MNERILINPKGTEVIYESMQFSQAVKVNNMIWVSGQVGINEQFETGKGIEEQTRMAFLNLKHVLEEAGASLADIVELVTYHINMNEMQQFSKIKTEFIPADYPAWTAVGVNELVLPGLLIEIRATAIITP
jgi:enamine deaminase RidA (YjgF/YER057c/UK114 family)